MPSFKGLNVVGRSAHPNLRPEQKFWRILTATPALACSVLSCPDVTLRFGSSASNNIVTPTFACTLQVHLILHGFCFSACQILSCGNSADGRGSAFRPKAVRVHFRTPCLLSCFRDGNRSVLQGLHRGRATQVYKKYIYIYMCYIR